MANIKFDLYDITFDADALPYFIENGISMGEIIVSGKTLKLAIENDEYRISNNTTGLKKSDVVLMLGNVPTSEPSLQEQVDALQAKISEMTSQLASNNVITKVQAASISNAVSKEIYE